MSAILSRLPGCAWRALSKEKVERYGLLETIDQRHFFPTIEVAIKEVQREV